MKKFSRIDHEVFLQRKFDKKFKQSGYPQKVGEKDRMKCHFKKYKELIYLRGLEIFWINPICQSFSPWQLCTKILCEQSYYSRDNKVSMNSRTKTSFYLFHFPFNQTVRKMRREGSRSSDECSRSTDTSYIIRKMTRPKINLIEYSQMNFVNDEIFFPVIQHLDRFFHSDFKTGRVSWLLNDKFF